MRILIQEDGHSLRLLIPTGCLLYGPGAWYLKKKLGQYKIPDSAAHVLLKTARQVHRQYPDWKLLEIHSADGDTIEIIL